VPEYSGQSSERPDGGQDSGGTSERPDGGQDSGGTSERPGGGQDSGGTSERPGGKHGSNRGGSDSPDTGYGPDGTLLTGRAGSQRHGHGRRAAQRPVHRLRLVGGRGASQGESQQGKQAEEKQNWSHGKSP
jgi:hypothetical protein